MSWLTETIRKISLPSAVFWTLFLWNGIVYLGFSRILPLRKDERLKYLLFGLTSLGLSVYSFATFQLYSNDTLAGSLFWCQLQMASTLPVFLCFLFFTALTLDLSRTYFFRVVPWITLLFIPFVFRQGGFFSATPTFTTFSLGPYSTRVLEAEPASVYFAYLAWTIPHLLYLAFAWIRHYRRHLGGIALPLGFTLFLLSILNDILIVTKAYSFFYLMEFGFAAFILTMGVQLFKHYVEGMRRLDAKTREVAALNEEMQFLVGAMSHDLKAPLISIRGFAELLEKGAEPGVEKRRSYLRRIETNADHMLGLIEDLLSYVKVGWVLEDRVPLDLERIVEEVSAQLTGGDPGLPARLAVPGRWPAAVSSARGLRHILLNLLQNAAKFCPEGKIRLAVSKRAGGLEIAVFDEGPGVAPEIRDKIFQPFFRGRKDMSGSGMGLAIVKKTAERLGGRAWLDSGRRKGACFRVFLPGGSAN